MRHGSCWYEFITVFPVGELPHDTGKLRAGSIVRGVQKLRD
jgi:hypothetical protein